MQSEPRVALEPAANLMSGELAQLINAAYAGSPAPVQMDATGFERFTRERSLHLGFSRAARGKGLALVGKRGARGYLASLGVVPSARGTGLAQGLLDDALAALARGGATTCTLEVREDNAPARRVYERSGFQTTRRLPCYHSPELVARNLDVKPVPLSALAGRYRRDAAWQNEPAAARALGARAYEGPGGYAVVAMGLRGATLLDVGGPEPGRVLDGLAAHYRDVRLTFANVPDEGVARALEARGWKRYAQQLEMRRTLTA